MKVKFKYKVSYEIEVEGDTSFDELKNTWDNSDSLEEYFIDKLDYNNALESLKEIENINNDRCGLQNIKVKNLEISIDNKTMDIK